MMLVVAVGLIRHSVGDVPSLVLAVAVFVALHFGKLNIILVVIGGTGVYWIGTVLTAGLR